MSRKNAREKAYQVLFSASFNNFEWESTLNEMQNEWNLNEEDLSFCKEICVGVVENLEELKKIIENNLKGYNFSQLYQSDKIVLLISLFELKFSKTPKAIIINEAVEISKKYGIEKSPKFVNGVLSGVLKSIWTKIWLV